MLVLCLGVKLDTGIVLPGILSDDNSAPSASTDALQWSFSDGAVIEYELENGALSAALMESHDDSLLRIASPMKLIHACPGGIYDAKY